MKLFLITMTIITTSFTACSHNNAFDRFEMSAQREFSEESIQSAKIIDGGEVKGVVTAVYLNKTYPELYKNAEYFYIYLNIDGDAKKNRFELNGKTSLLVEELNTTNEFTHLTLFDAAWKHYYLVGFKAVEGELKLDIKNDNSSSSLHFTKNF